MILTFIIIGLVGGAVYGLAGVGLVLTYKTSGVFNFAHGSLAAVSAYVFYSLHVQLGWAWPLAAFVAIFVVGPPLAFLLERLAKVLAGKGITLMVASTVGMLLTIVAVIVLVYGVTETRVVPGFLGEGTFTLAGARVSVSQVVTFAIAVVLTAALYVFFRYSRTGASMRAVVDDPGLLELSGTSSTRIRRYAWLIGVLLVCTSGVLFSTLLPLDSTQLTLLVVQAFGAAAIGAFRNLPMTFFGGLLIGVLASLATNYVTSGPLLGLPASLPFVVLFLVLLIFPKRYLAERSVITPLSRPTWVTPAPVQVVGGATIFVVLLVVPSFAGIHLADWTIALANIIMFLSLGLLVRTAGVVSLCHVTFLAIGATTFGHLTSDVGLPWLAALALTGLAAVPIGALLAIPAIRLTPLYLALATFGFGIFVQYMFYQQEFMFGPTGAGVTVPRPQQLGLDSDTGYYYLLLAFVVLSVLGVTWLNRSRLGRLLRGLADSPTAVATSGATAPVSWVLVFCISAAMAAVAGALSAGALQTVSITGYPPLQSLSYFVLVVIMFGGDRWAPVFAGILFTIPPSYFPGFDTSYWLQILFGVGAIAYATMPESKLGFPPGVQRLLDGAFRRGATIEKPDREERTVDTGPDFERVGEARLEVVDLTLRFGGLVAVNELSLEAPTGRVTGLIGPNGAGKTTTFNACSGLIAPSNGTVRLDDRDIGSIGTSGRARLGVGRTFQQMQLFDSLTVTENVALGAEAPSAASNPIRHVIGRRGDRRRVASATQGALRLCGISDLANVPAGSLSTGQRRLVELARCLAGPHRILLLDEPSSGLDRAETAQFGEILQRAVRDRGVGILLVEHDMELVMSICDQIYVLDFGQLIFDGTPEQVIASPVVQAAYLGTVADGDAVDPESIAAVSEGALR